MRLTSDSSDTSLPATLTMNMSMPNLAAGAPHSRANSQSPLTKVPIYDYLSPRGTKCQLDNKDNGASPRVDDSYVCFRPSMDSTDITGTSPDAQESPIYSPTYSHPVLSDEVLRHQYEYLPPLSQEQSDKKDDAFDSYVYMAPRNDAHLLPQNVSPRVLLRSTSASFTTPTKQGNEKLYLIIVFVFQSVVYDSLALIGLFFIIRCLFRSTCQKFQPREQQ